MRKVQGSGGTGSAVLHAEGDDTSRGSAPTPIRRPLTDPLRPRRELVDNFAEDEDTEAFLRASGRNRRIRRGLIPQTRNGWIAAGVGTLLCLLALAAGATLAARFLTTSAKFRIPSSMAIEIDGNNHLARSQMLSVFGEDIDRNIFRVPMQQRRAQLEAMPWVEHATVMRLLPNRIRVQVTERVPVAFVRQGGNIGMADANGVLLDIPPDAPGNPSYSFPVVTGLKAEDSPGDRAERMKLYAVFLKDLDSTGLGISRQLSEVDLSDPEDVKALIPDHNAEVLVHFGTENFLARYKKFEDHVVEWRTQYPRLSSVDMRYERQVVLQMPSKDSTVISAAAEKPAPLADTHTPHAKATAEHVTPSARPPAHVLAVKHAAIAKGPAAAKDAATRKRVEAIKAWIVKRDKMRAAGTLPPAAPATH